MRRQPVCPECKGQHIAEIYWVQSLAYIEEMTDDKAAPDGVRIEYTGETYHTDNERHLTGDDRYHCGCCGHEFNIPDWIEYITVLTSHKDTHQLKETSLSRIVKYCGHLSEEEIATIIDDHVAKWVANSFDDVVAWGWKRQ